MINISKTGQFLKHSKFSGCLAISMAQKNNDLRIVRLICKGNEISTYPHMISEQTYLGYKLCGFSRVIDPELVQISLIKDNRTIAQLQFDYEFQELVRHDP